jgi:predicted dehydrogenase
MNVLIIGLGSIARKHIAALNSMRDFQYLCFKIQFECKIEEGK